MDSRCIDDFLEDGESGDKSDSSTDSVKCRGFRVLEMPERGGGRLERLVPNDGFGTVNALFKLYHERYTTSGSSIWATQKG